MSKLKLYCDLRNTREDYGYSQKELSKMTGISLLTIKKIEDQKFIPTVRIALLLAIALETTVDDLFWLYSKEDDLDV